MNIKMIATDLDRTLLRTDKTISAYTADILNRCRQKGIKIVFATARPKRTVDHFCLDIPTDALILHNGAVIYTDKKPFANFGIESILKDNILQSLSKNYPDANLSVEINDVLYANFDIPTDIFPEWNYTKSDFLNLPPSPADKIIIDISSMEDIKRFEKHIPEDLYIEMSSGDNINLGLIMNRQATKWNALQAVSAHFNIPTSDIVAFGDDYNDIDMIHGCGIGVAVSNSINEAKNIADHICDTNQNDGVAKWLEENLLQN